MQQNLNMPVIWNSLISLSFPLREVASIPLSLKLSWEQCFEFSNPQTVLTKSIIYFCSLKFLHCDFIVSSYHGNLEP